MYRAHLRTLLGNGDVGENVPTEIGRGLDESPVLVYIKVNCVSGQAGAETAHHARRQLTAERGSREQEDGRLMLLDKFHERILVNARLVFGQLCAFNADDLLRTVGEEQLAVLRGMLAEDNSGDLIGPAKLFLEVDRFC